MYLKSLEQGEMLASQWEDADVEAGGATSFTWEDEYTKLIWPNSVVRGETLAAVIGSYGEDGLIRLMGVAGRAARGMTRAAHAAEGGGGGGGGGGVVV